MSTLKRKRNGIYSNSTGSLVYDPIKGEARSYGWYILAKRIGGVMYLNTYGYSVTTSKHVSIMHKHFGYTGYECIEAPQGLQDLESALNYSRERAQHFIEKHEKSKRTSTRERYLEAHESWINTQSKIELLKQCERIGCTA